MESTRLTMNACTGTDDSISKDKPLVSLIVPIYRAECYLRQCIDSLLAQDYPNIEIILIDDGSPDHCGAICDEYALQNPKISVFHQSNQGVSAARNDGVSLARGEYIAFVDADDWIEPDYIAYLMELVQKYECDMSFLFQAGYPTAQAEKSMAGSQALEGMLYQTMFDTAPWGKLFKRNTAQEHPFPVGMFFEDLAVVCQMVASSHRAAGGNRQLYHYRQTPGGTMNGGDVMRLLDELKAADMMFDYITDHVPALTQAAVCRKFSAYCQVYCKLPKAGYHNEKQKIWHALCTDRWRVLRDSHARIKNRVAAAVSYLGANTLQALWKIQKG